MIILLQLVEGERKAVYEDCENEKNDNREKVKKMKEEIRELQGRLRDSTASSEPVLKHVQGRRYLQLNVLKKKSGEDAVEASVMSENDYTERGISASGLGLGCGLWVDRLSFWLLHYQPHWLGQKRIRLYWHISRAQGGGTFKIIVNPTQVRDQMPLPVHGFCKLI